MDSYSLNAYTVGMKLEEISAAHRDAFLEMAESYEPADREQLFGAKAWDAKKFDAFVKKCEKERQDWRPKGGKVSITRFVLVGDDGRIYGNGVMRFPLNPAVEKSGGNLIFDVPPPLRRQGYGALTLNRMLFQAVRAGLARALITCSEDNTGARKCIEKNRGELDEVKGGLARYWLRLR
jgi:predicted acetyltransferase